MLKKYTFRFSGISGLGVVDDIVVIGDNDHQDVTVTVLPGAPAFLANMGKEDYFHQLGEPPQFRAIDRHPGAGLGSTFDPQIPLDTKVEDFNGELPIAVHGSQVDFPNARFSLAISNGHLRLPNGTWLMG